MSDRTLAAQVLRYGLKEFWPDNQHWLQGGFKAPLHDPTGQIIGDARCIEQMMSDSVRAVIHDPALWGRVRASASEAIAQTFGMPMASSMLAINDNPDMTYEKIRAHVEQAARELESIE